IGRFFVIHDAQATRDSTRLKTYEFLHATFGEYLIARLVTRELADLVDTATRSATRSRPAPPDDAFLHALLSFAPLTLRGTVVSFLSDRLRMLASAERNVLCGVLLDLFHHSLMPRHETSYENYQPYQISLPSRPAHYSANLVLLAVLAAGEVTGKQLFPQSIQPVQDWRRLASLWRSQLPENGWDNFVETFELHRGWDDDHRLPADWLSNVIRRIKDVGGRADIEGPELVRIARENLPELMFADPW
ncbi:MAG TPA: hypothetical protein VFO16_09805, partial [Pseudonocardiaceae bacterium]|nr:hypothetical protein [Pseudonocardiaceae bacterium]